MKINKADVTAVKIKASLMHPLFFFLKRYFSISYINKLVFMFFILSVVYAAIVFIPSENGAGKIKLSAVTEKIVPTKQKLGLKQKSKPLEPYLQGVRIHRIFGGISYQAAETKEKSDKAAVDLVKDISLLGVISDDNPQAVIEDKKTQKTYYLNKGQFIGEFQVQDIQPGKVILKYNDQKFELYL